MVRKTAAITAAAIAGVILAGGAAVGANIGILNAADNSALGELSAEAPLATPNLEPEAVVQPVSATSDSDSSTQSFTVDAAGMVDLELDDNGLRVDDVRTNQGWTWEDTSVDDSVVTITFTSGADALEFSAATNTDGSISASVDRPIITPSQNPTPANGTTATYSDDHYDEYDDHDEYEDDGDDDEYEDDGDGDDHDEYEGRDEDD